MVAIPRKPTTNMEVTSIRLERELKHQLKQIAGAAGYQALIRDILWNYVQQKSGQWQPRLARADIGASMPARAEQEQRCALTGKIIHPQEPMLLGLTKNSDIVTLSIESLAH